MNYSEQLINISDRFCENDVMYSLILLSAKALTITLSGYRCFLDGKYIVCLNNTDKLAVHSGHYEAKNISFQPYFYNTNLTDIFYDEMRDKYGYPDFHLFRMRDADYFGIIHISDEQYNTAALYFERTNRDIAKHGCDEMWSYRARADIISILNVAEAARSGKQSDLENEILRYIHDNISSGITLEKLCTKFNTNRTTLSRLIKEKTLLPPIRYFSEMRLLKSCYELVLTEAPINKIAEKYGFSDANYYIRSFKKRFGMTPLQYRKTNSQNSVPDENADRKQTEPAPSEMTVDEFIDYYNKGLGRAVIKLKQQKDKAKFKEAFMKCIFQDSHRSLDIYEKEIIDIFDDEDFAKEIEAKFLNELSEKFATRYIPFLILTGKRNDVEDIIERYYKASYTELLEYTKKTWDGDKYPKSSKTFMRAAGSLGRYLKVGDKRIKEILFDIADLYEYADFPVIPTYQNPLFQLWDGVGKEHFFLILDEVIKEHKHGIKIDIRREIVFSDDEKPSDMQADKNSVEIDIAEKILACNELTCDDKLLLEFENADKKSIEKVAKAAIDETDISRKAYLLYFFVCMFPEDKPVEFPLDVTPLAEWLEENDYRIGNEATQSVTRRILNILEHKRHKAARKVGLKLFREDKFKDGHDRWFNFSIRFGVNYDPDEDKADLIAMLRSRNSKDKNIAFEILLSDIRFDVKGLPLDIIPYLFADIDYSRREDLCEVLSEKNLFPEELKEECLYDCNKRVRELFLKTQKPKKKPIKVFLVPPETPV